MADKGKEMMPTSGSGNMASSSSSVNTTTLELDNPSQPLWRLSGYVPPSSEKLRTVFLAEEKVVIFLLPLSSAHHLRILSPTVRFFRLSDSQYSLPVETSVPEESTPEAVHHPNYFLVEFLFTYNNLHHQRISGTGLSGQLPDFIVSWTQLERLRISDILGTSSKFPDLSRQNHLSRLILRNCLLFGQIPDYIGQFKALRILDLSFNNLTVTDVAGEVVEIGLGVQGFKVGDKVVSKVKLLEFIIKQSSGCLHSGIFLITRIQDHWLHSTVHWRFGTPPQFFSFNI
ncbi:probable LRR receptor-like serine/threonine-protein kinase At1g07650 [Nymphaea colorata]|nr:probable LRR receptor-like serine/threonine-protein kinase At1g07650 [Nymphaea colorata]